MRSVPLVLLACVAAAIPFDPALATDAATLCLGAAGESNPDAPALQAAVQSSEAMIATAADRAAAGDRAIAALNAASVQVPAADERTLASFCNAAGEAYRLGNGGSPYQAQQMLLAAFRHAESAGDRADSATAAYRLGIVAASGTVAANGSRGARRSAAGSDASSSSVPQLELSDAGSDACPWLNDSRLRDQSQAFIAYVALQCALDRAGTGANAKTAARAGVKLARFWSTIAVRQPDNAKEARAEALRAALAALRAVRLIDKGDLREPLTAAAVEAALDAGGAGEPLVRESVRTVAALRTGDPQQAAQALALQARLRLAEGDRVGAAALLRRATFLEAQAVLPDRLADWHLLLAKADPANGAQHIADAFRALNAVRPALGAYDPITEESVFSLRIRPVYEALVDTMLASTPGEDVGRIDQIQAVVEEYRQAELQSLFGTECVAPRPPIKPSELRPTEVLLYPILLPDRVELLYASGRDPQPRYRRLPVNRNANRSQVAALVLKLVQATSSGNTGWQGPARALYDVLIRPVEGELSPGTTLVVIPDGPLAAMPFAALVDADGKFLVERTRLSTVPALAYSQPGEGRQRPNLAVIAAALEKEVVLPAGAFPQLVGTGEEARFAYQVGGAGGDDALIENFHRADLIRVLSHRQADVLHLATHASFNGRSDRSYIVADGEAIPLSELRSLISTNQARGNQLDLLILSACETAVGDEQASMGLAGAAVQAGATSALASLWQVNDEGTKELMKAFYNRYKAGESKAEALRGAQMELIQRGGAFADPNVWAAFTLLGGWR